MVGIPHEPRPGGRSAVASYLGARMIPRPLCTIAIAGLLQAPQAPVPFRSAVDVVPVDVSVVRDATPVSGLTAANFVLADDGLTHEVISMTLQRPPLAGVLVLDGSRRGP